MSDSDAPGPVLESALGRPTAALRPHVAWYTGYRQAGLAPGLHRGLPSPYLTLIVTFDEPLTVARHPDPAAPPGQYRTLVGGLHTTPALIKHDGRQSGVQLAVNPLGARALLGLPAGELAGVDLDADAVLGSAAAELHERISAAATWPERFAVLDEMVGRRAQPEAAARPEVEAAWRRLLADGGGANVAELAAEVGWSTRRLRDQFLTEIGLTPKAAARVIRFDRARRRLQQAQTQAGRPGLAHFAAEAGYFDQAHLARDFREFAGCPPSQWLAEECRNVQALPADALAGSEA